ncbi:phosphonatase-like hydrolase [Mucilaginibacter sp. OK268]|jgi:phosphonatase-like hydrolase|uniref:HAD hydrolase-like protein n=1 Tax=Mucilaginibacter sp. OK268 TaxID=1881048 RepID=UPI00087E282C|nr:HAD hydrolase-like protein [Mucilaginibacter sp. OK268]SDP02393.1 phosphonatase-like hydrolase [Mucilaginibacter sp. OK268]
MAIKLVVFDIAGTTVKDDQEVSKAFQAALKKYNYNIELNRIDPLMGYEKTLAIKQILLLIENDTDKITPELISDIHKEFVQQMIRFYQYEPGIEPLPHAEETLAALRAAGVKVGINTGFSRDIADTIVTRLQWREKGLIDYVVGSDEVELGRPHPYMIQKMMLEAGITDPLQVVKVGDTEVDVREGQNVGCKYVIAVTTGAFTREQLEPYNPSHIIDDIAQVIDIINQ